jgi:hypothetical protein
MNDMLPLSRTLLRKTGEMTSSPLSRENPAVGSPGAGAGPGTRSGASTVSKAISGANAISGAIASAGSDSIAATDSNPGFNSHSNFASSPGSSLGSSFASNPGSSLGSSFASNPGSSSHSSFASNPGSTYSSNPGSTYSYNPASSLGSNPDSGSLRVHPAVLASGTPFPPTAFDPEQRLLQRLPPQESTGTDMPPAPRSLADLGIGLQFVEDLILKHLLTMGALHADDIAGLLGIPLDLLMGPLGDLRRKQLLDARDLGRGSVAALLYLSLSTAGRIRAQNCIHANAYCGPLPVPLHQYTRQVRRQTVDFPGLLSARAWNLLQEYRVPESVIAALEPSLRTRDLLWLRGSPHGEKGVLAQWVARNLVGEMAIPYAVEAQGHVIRIFDPSVHALVNHPSSMRMPWHEQEVFDRRWMRCKRVLIAPHKPLEQASLDLLHFPMLGFYEAPLQIKANGGILLLEEVSLQVDGMPEVLRELLARGDAGMNAFTLQDGTPVRFPLAALMIMTSRMNVAPWESGMVASWSGFIPRT